MTFQIKRAIKAEDERDTLKAELERLKSQGPVAWMVYAKDSRRYFTLTFDVNKVPEIYLGGEALPLFHAAGAAPTLTTCNCRWDGEKQVQQCTLHEAHVDAIHEWAERAKTAEATLAAPKEQEFCEHGTPYRYSCDQCAEPKKAVWKEHLSNEVAKEMQPFYEMLAPKEQT